MLNEGIARTFLLGVLYAAMVYAAGNGIPEENRWNDTIILLYQTTIFPTFRHLFPCLPFLEMKP